MPGRFRPLFAPVLVAACMGGAYLGWQAWQSGRALNALTEVVQSLDMEAILRGKMNGLSDEEKEGEDSTVDLALLSQALHHAQKPSRALEAAWDILKSGGCLVVLDLLQHGQEEARELYADRWLGFTPAALESMLKEAGFRNIHTDIVDREPDPPHFQTLMAAAWKP